MSRTMREMTGVVMSHMARRTTAGVAGEATGTTTGQASRPVAPVATGQVTLAIVAEVTRQTARVAVSQITREVIQAVISQMTSRIPSGVVPEVVPPVGVSVSPQPPNALSQKQIRPEGAPEESYKSGGSAPGKALARSEPARLEPRANRNRQTRRLSAVGAGPPAPFTFPIHGSWRQHSWQ
jgi:hypothetical protein